MTELAIEARGLRKSYGPLEALKGVDISVRAGEVFCLIGPNGAGKTTCVEILEGHRDRDAGEVRVLGHDPARHERALRARLGIVLQRTGVEPFLTVEEVVELFRGYYPHPRPLGEVLEAVGLADKRSSLVRRLSVGQMRRLDVAVALAGDPELLFLDEPTTGFDPAARRGAWEMVRGLRSLGKTVFLTTHYMDEAEALSDRVAVIAGGEIVSEGTMDDLRGPHAATVIHFRIPDGAAGFPLADARVRDGVVELETAEPTRALNEITSWAIAGGIELDGLTVSRVSLEDIYLQLTAEPQEAETGE